MRDASAPAEDGLAREGDPAALRLMVNAGALGLGAADGSGLKSLWMNEGLAHRLFTLGAVNMSHAHGDREIAVLLTAWSWSSARASRPDHSGARLSPDRLR
jgi:hypothetical protein